MNTELKLGVNIDHVATLRQVRLADYPNPVEAARLCADAGAHGLTVHLREDRRHIQDHDVYTLKEEKILPLNLEMGNHPEIVDIALSIVPDEVCLVPEKRQELTTEGGLDVAGNYDALEKTVARLSEKNIIVSMFIDPDPGQIEASARMGAPYVEFHTGTYCDKPSDAELKRLVEGAELAHELKLHVNAGHGINVNNIAGILHMPHLEVLNIGHSVVARAVMVGMKEAVREILAAMSAYRGGSAPP